jgi:hypothetical protein
MNCSNCGQPLEAGAQFCGSCGTAVAQPAAPVPTQTYAQPVATPAAAPTPDPLAFAPAPAPVPAPEPLAAPAAPAPMPAPAPAPMPAMAPAPVVAMPAPMPAPHPVAASAGTNTKAVLALVFGVVALPASLIPLIGIPLGIAALVLGIVSRKPHPSGMGLAGMILGPIAIVISIIIWILTFIALSNSSTYARFFLSMLY